MLLVNLYAGPCSGKSTLASDIFTKLKRAGVQAEIPPEVAKLRSQRGDYAFLADQLAVFGETQHQLNMAKRSGAQVAVVDSPLLLSLVYAPKPYLSTFPSLVREIFDRFGPSLDYFLRRDPSIQFSAVGRVHDERESLQKDVEILAMMREQKLDVRMIDSSEAAAERVVADVLLTLKAAPPAPREPRAAPRRPRLAA